MRYWRSTRRRDEPAALPAIVALPERVLGTAAPMRGADIRSAKPPSLTREDCERVCVRLSLRAASPCCLGRDRPAQTAMLNLSGNYRRVHRARRSRSASVLKMKSDTRVNTGTAISQAQVRHGTCWACSITGPSIGRTASSQQKHQVRDRCRIRSTPS